MQIIIFSQTLFLNDRSKQHGFVDFWGNCNKKNLRAKENFKKKGFEYFFRSSVDIALQSFYLISSGDILADRMVVTLRY